MLPAIALKELILRMVGMRHLEEKVAPQGIPEGSVEKPIRSQGSLGREGHPFPSVVTLQEESLDKESEETKIRLETTSAEHPEVPDKMEVKLRVARVLAVLEVASPNA